MSKTLTYETARLLGLPFRFGDNPWTYQYLHTEKGPELWRCCKGLRAWERDTNDVSAERFRYICTLVGPAVLVEDDDGGQT